MNLLIVSIICLISAICPHRAIAGIKLPALIGNSMVLQQNTLINMWGWADKGDSISIAVSWQEPIVTAKAGKDGKWKVPVQTPKAGGPYTIKISDHNYSILIENVMIGEVWVCSGQSNMEFTIRGLGGLGCYSADVRQQMHKTDFSPVRVFTVQKDTSHIRLDNCRWHWQVADTAAINDFSATAWFFGSYLYQKLKIPIGLIVTAWGGTPAEVWTPLESIKSDPALGYFLNPHNGSESWPGSPGVLFNAMIYPLLNYTIKGAIWYQCESNRLDAKLYPELMKTMVSSWRKEWGLGEFHFYYVQIAPYTYEEPRSGALLREAQLKCLEIPNSGMAITLDIAGDITDIHPKNKLDVGKRLALWALNKTYNLQTGSFSGPLFKNITIDRQTIKVKFDYAAEGMKLKKDGSTNFMVSGTVRVFYQATAKIKDNELLLSSPKVKKPVAVMYAFENTSEATLFNMDGLPASSFRSDNWYIISQKVGMKYLYDLYLKTISYELFSEARESEIYYSLGKKCSSPAIKYTKPISAGKDGILCATIARNGYKSESCSSYQLSSNKALAAKIEYAFPYSSKYAWCGQYGLVDGILGTEKFTDGLWQGFEDNDLDVIIDLGKPVKVNSISCHFLSNQASWIFLPKSVAIETSKDGKDFKSVDNQSSFSQNKQKEPFIMPVLFNLKNEIKYIRFRAKNQSVCPEGHQGAGGKAWLFIDEIVVK